MIETTEKEREYILKSRPDLFSVKLINGRLVEILKRDNRRKQGPRKRTYSKI